MDSLAIVRKESDGTAIDGIPKISVICFLLLICLQAICPASDAPTWGSEVEGIQVNLTFQQEQEGGAGAYVVSIKNNSGKTVKVQNDKDVHGIFIQTEIGPARGESTFYGETATGRTDLYTFEIPDKGTVTKTLFVSARSIGKSSGAIAIAKIVIDSRIVVMSNFITLP